MLFRYLFLAALFLQYCWPRYFFLNIAGKGASGYTASTLAVGIATLYTLATSSAASSMLARQLTRSWPIFLTFMLYWLWRFVCDMVGINSGMSLPYSLGDFVFFASWFFGATVFFADPRTRDPLPIIIFVSAIIAVLFGLNELRTGLPLSQTLGFADVQAGNAYKLDAVNATLMRNGLVRVRSIFYHPLIYGQMLAGMTPVALHFLFRPGSRPKIMGAILMACIVTSVLICNARSPFLIVMLSAALYLALYFLDPYRNRRMFIALAAIVGVAACAPIAAEAVLALSTGRTAEEVISSNARDRMIATGVSALKLRPISGYGSNTSGAIAGIATEKNQVTIDNWYLSVAIDNGYLGLLLFCVMLLTIVLRGAWATIISRGTQDRSELAFAVATIAGLSLGLTIISISDTVPTLYTMAGLIVAVDASRRAGTRRDARAADLMRSLTRRPQPRITSILPTVDR